MAAQSTFSRQGLEGPAWPVADANGNSPDGAGGRWLDGVFYPASDGERMADDSAQAAAMGSVMMDLLTHFPHAFVTVDMLLYYCRGVVRRRTAPDVLVAFGVGAHHRSSYIPWHEGKPPDWVLEVTSTGTVAKDLDEKRDIYQAAKVPEYWLFDRKRRVLPAGGPSLQGLRLCHGKYVAIEPRFEGGRRLLRSEALGLDVGAEGRLLRFREVASGEDLLHQAEEKAARMAATRRAERALAEVAELEAGIQRLQRQA